MNIVCTNTEIVKIYTFIAANWLYCFRSSLLIVGYLVVNFLVYLFIYWNSRKAFLLVCYRSIESCICTDDISADAICHFTRLFQFIRKVPLHRFPFATLPYSQCSSSLCFAQGIVYGLEASDCTHKFTCFFIYSVTELPFAVLGEDLIL